MMDVEAFDDVAKMREAVNWSTFAAPLPTGLHRWVNYHKPANLTDASRIADEYAILSKPFKTETAHNSAGSSFRSDTNVVKGNSSRNWKHGPIRN